MVICNLAIKFSKMIIFISLQHYHSYSFPASKTFLDSIMAWCKHMMKKCMIELLWVVAAVVSNAVSLYYCYKITKTCIFFEWLN